MTVRRIAVTTDFSEDSRATFAAAASLARKFSAELHVLHLAHIPPALVSPWPEVGPYLLPDDFFAEAAKRLDDLIRTEPAFTGLEVRARIIRGETAESIRGFMEEEKIELLVMAPRGMSAVKRFLLGSFTERVLRVSPSPVLVLHPRPDVPSVEVQPRRILVPHDFSPTSRAALALAREWTAAFGASARLHFVVEHQASLYGYAAHMEGSFQEYLQRVREEALRRFRRIIDEEWKGLPVEAVATTGDPVEEILRDAAAQSADLIVIGTHSRSGLERFLGSVAQKIIRRAACPVLITRGGAK